MISNSLLITFKLIIVLQFLINLTNITSFIIYKSIKSTGIVLVTPTITNLEYVPNTIKSKYWSEREVSYLIEARSKNLVWDDISKQLNRPLSSCYRKYFEVINKNYQFSIENINLLLHNVVKYGENWTKISDELNVNKDICRVQYLNILRRFNKGPWNENEDDLLLTIYFENCKNVSSSLENINVKDFFRSSPSAYFHIYAQNTQIPWRNISHILKRSPYDCRKRFLQISFNRTLTPDVWLQGETNRLFELVRERGFQWSEVSRELGRTESQCFNLYHNSIRTNKYHIDNNYNNSKLDNVSEQIKNKKLFSRPWTKDDDEQLIKYQSIYGNKWKLIGSYMNRTSPQCCQRYLIIQSNLKNPNKIGWTDEENMQLHQLVQEYGAQWTLISKKLNSNPFKCREAYKRLVDKSHYTLKMPKYSDAINKNINYISNNDITIGFSNYDYNNETIHDTYSNNSIIYNNTVNNLLNNLKSISMKRNNKVAKLWTKEEDEYVAMLVKYVGRKWLIIAEAIGRSPEDVMIRHDFKLAPKKKGFWSKKEEKQLLDLIDEIGPRWSQIGEILGRTDLQCHLKYRQSLDPRLQWRLWSNDEDEQLISLREDSGYNWGMISAVMGRAAGSCRYRYLKLQRMNQQNNFDSKDNISKD